MSKRVLAFDLGASSGRAMLAEYADGRIETREVHRFPNEPVLVNGTLYWDILRLLHEIKQGLVKGRDAGGYASIAIDTWGVDFGLLDEDGVLLENPVHYRDNRNTGVSLELDREFPLEKLYNLTGNQIMDLNSIFQLYWLRKHRPQALARAKTLLFTPDLLIYMLTGIRGAEYTMVSTSGLLDAKTRDWSPELLSMLGAPRSLFPAITQPGTIIGRLPEGLCEEMGIPSADVIAVGEHDTASAVIGVPAAATDFAYVSCGTWSLFGTELDAPLINEQTRRRNLTNEGGCFGKIRFLKNIVGLWLIQESRRQWKREGQDYSYAELERRALEAPAFESFIDPDAPDFVPQGNLPRRVREFCERTGQPVPLDVGGVMRCIYQSLAMKYRHTFEQLMETTGKRYRVIHVVGGGAKDGLLCQMTADATGVNVVAGPVEATVLGNVAVQLIALGEIESLSEARRVIARSQPLSTYRPRDAAAWEEGYRRFRAALGL